jgi:hypothetical protein
VVATTREGKLRVAQGAGMAQLPHGSAVPIPAPATNTTGKEEQVTKQRALHHLEPSACATNYLHSALHQRGAQGLDARMVLVAFQAHLDDPGAHEAHGARGPRLRCQHRQ